MSTTRTPKATRTPIRTARNMSTREIAQRIREALIERAGHNFRVTASGNAVKIKPYSLKNRRELRALLNLSAVPMPQFHVSRPEKLVEYLHRAEGHAR